MWTLPELHDHFNSTSDDVSSSASFLWHRPPHTNTPEVPDVSVETKEFPWIRPEMRSYRQNLPGR